MDLQIGVLAVLVFKISVDLLRMFFLPLYSACIFHCEKRVVFLSVFCSVSLPKFQTPFSLFSIG